MEHSQSLASMLRAILIDDKGLSVNVTIQSEGLKAITEKNKTMQATSFIPRSLFKRFELTGKQAEFRMDLKNLLNCLGIFVSPSNDTLHVTDNPNTDSQMLQVETDSSMKFYYKSHGYPLELTIGDKRFRTSCQITTLDPLEQLTFERWPDDILAKLSVDSEVLVGMWSGLDTSSELLNIRISDEDQAVLTLTTKSDYGKSRTTLARDDEAVRSVELRVTSTFVENNYYMCLLSKSLRALAPSQKTMIRMAANGTLCIQYVYALADNTRAYVEYNCAAVVDEDDEETCE
jgi:hypothetical protein